MNKSNTSKERWKDIPGYSGLYAVSTKGRIWRYKRKVTGKCGHYRTLAPKFLTLNDNGRGYLQVNLHKNKRRKMHYVHRLVALTFIKNKKGKFVNHKDFNRSNNHVNNLEWVTIKQNHKWSANKGRYDNARTKQKDICKKIFSKKIICIETKKVYSSGKAAGLFYDIHPKCITDAALGRQKTAGGYHWKYV